MYRRPPFGRVTGSRWKKYFCRHGNRCCSQDDFRRILIYASSVTLALKSLKTEFTLSAYPALLGVGYICGPKVAAMVFSGGLFSWFVLIPAIVAFGEKSVLYPARVSIEELYASGGASAIWSNYIRYIGAGALAAAGIISLIKSLPLIISTFSSAVRDLKHRDPSTTERTSKDMSMTTVFCVLEP